MLDQILALLHRTGVISQFLTQQINSAQKERLATLSLTSFYIVLVTSFRATSARGRKEGRYLLGNKPKGAVAKDWRLSACTNTYKKELNTTCMTLRTLPLDLPFGPNLCLKRAKMPCYLVTQHEKTNVSVLCHSNYCSHAPNWRLMSFNLSHKLFLEMAGILLYDPIFILSGTAWMNPAAILKK